MDERELMERSLREGLPALGLALDGEQISRLLDFGQAVLAQNRVMNLTAVTDPADFARLHLLDSLALLPAAELDGCSLLDVGTGAGFPGVPLKIACPSLRLTLLDSTAKKIRWLAQTLPGLGIEAETVAARAEEFAPQFDVVTSRAVARLNLLCELCQPRVRVGGWFYALRGRRANRRPRKQRRPSVFWAVRCGGLTRCVCRTGSAARSSPWSRRAPPRRAIPGPGAR